MRKLPSTQIKTLGKQVHGETYFPSFIYPEQGLVSLEG